jgi:hypothetical protein
MRPTRWTNKEIALLRRIYATAAPEELTQALPRHRLRTIRIRAHALGLRRATLARPSIRERQRQRMERAGGYLAKRVAELGGYALTHSVRDLAGSAALECLIAAAAASIQSRQQTEASADAGARLT